MQRRLGKRGAKRGQFVVIAALVIALLVLGTALGIHQMSQDRLQFRYKSVKETVLAIASDFDRALTHALALASQEFNDTGYDGWMATDSGNGFIGVWTRSAMTAESNLGLQIQTQPAKGDLGAQYSDFTFDWASDNGRGTSVALCSFDMNVVSYGLSGWNASKKRGVELALEPDSIIGQTNSASLNFSLTEWTGPNSSSPVPDLQRPDIVHLEAEVYPGIWLPNIGGNVTSLVYQGAGRYSMSISVLGGWLTYTKGIRMMIRTPDDGILVAASYGSPTKLVWNLASKEMGGASQDLGWITLGTVMHDLPDTYSETASPQQLYLNYWPENWTYSFVNWTLSTDPPGIAQVADARSWETSITVTGPGVVNVTAFYGAAGLGMEVGLNVSAQYLGKITGQTPSGTITVWNGSWTWSGTVGPRASDTKIVQGITLGDYSIEFTPPPPQGQGKNKQTYYFAYWSQSGAVWPLNIGPPGPYSWPWTNRSLIKLVGKGSVTAYYASPITLTVDSEFVPLVQGQTGTSHLGTVTLDSTPYSPLPQTIPATIGVHNLEYETAPGYYFIGWRLDSSGATYVYANWSTTVLRLLADGGTVTALYTVLGESEQPPPGGTWYIWPPKNDPSLIPYPPSDADKVHPYSQPKGSMNITSLPIPGGVTVADPADVALYMRVNPGQTAKSVYVEIGFWYEGNYYKLGSNTTRYVLGTDLYRIPVDTTDAQNVPGYPEQYMPTGSNVTLYVRVDFSGPPYGTLFLYYGGIEASRAALFDAVKITIQTDPTWSGVTFVVDPKPDGSNSTWGTTGPDGKAAVVVQIGTHTIKTLNSSIQTDDVWLHSEWWSITPEPNNTVVQQNSMSCVIKVAWEGNLTLKYDPEYRLQVISEVNGVEIGGPTGSGWYPSEPQPGVAYAGLNSSGEVIARCVYNGSYVRYRFINWIGDASGTGAGDTLVSNPIFMTSPKVAVANWTNEYYLNVTAVDQFGQNATPPVVVQGAGWYNESSVALVVLPLNATIGEAALYNLTYLEVDGLSDFNRPVAGDSWMLTLPTDGPHNVTAHYVKLYNLTVPVWTLKQGNQKDADVTSQVSIWINGTLMSAKHMGWYSANVKLNVSGYVQISISGQNYVFDHVEISSSGPSLIVTGAIWYVIIPMGGAYNVTACYRP